MNCTNNHKNSPWLEWIKLFLNNFHQKKYFIIKINYASENSQKKRIFFEFFLFLLSFEECNARKLDLLIFFSFSLWGPTMRREEDDSKNKFFFRSPILCFFFSSCEHAPRFYTTWKSHFFRTDILRVCGSKVHDFFGHFISGCRRP